MSHGTCRRRAGARRGFTLIETALTTVIVGVGVLAIVAAQAAFHQKNNWSTHASVAMHLGNEIREMTLNLPRNDPVTGDATWGPEEPSFEFYDDLDDFDGAAGTGLIFSAALGNGPINAQRQIIPNMDGWAQEIYVYSVDPFDITLEVADGSTNAVVVEVVVTFQGVNDPDPVELTRVRWISPN